VSTATRTTGLKPIQKAIYILRQTGPLGPNTIQVSGSCKENITIQSMDNLTLTAENGASISDHSNGNLDVIDIFDSQRVSINGFTINGGNSGVVCGGASLCRLSGNTIQNTSFSAVSVGSSQAGLSGDILQNNLGRGLSVIASQVGTDSITVQGNDSGIVVVTQGRLILGNSAVQGNHGQGVFAVEGSTIRVLNSNISSNGSHGVRLAEGSQARFESFAGPSSITNGGNGVLLEDLSFAFFAVGNTVTGSASGTDVVCSPQFTATRGALTNIGGGITNCVEP
jgi:hypothetical protein